MNNDYLNNNVTRSAYTDYKYSLSCKADNVQMRKTGNVQGRTTEIMQAELSCARKHSIARYQSAITAQ